jgi:hypothetical protein
MITSLLVDVVSWVIETALQLLDSIIPQTLLDMADDVVSQFTAILSFVPAAAFAYLLGAWFLFDTALNAYTFAWETYRLVPAKFT